MVAPGCEDCGAVEATVTDAFPWGIEHRCEHCADRRNERAFERMLSDFYGGSGPASLEERMDDAYRVKREGR